MEAEDGAWYCWNHCPGFEEERALARSKGGLRSTRKLRQHRYLNPDELSLLTTPEHAKHWAATIALGVATGRLSASAGSTALKAVEAFLRSLETIDLQERLAALEQRQLEAEQQRARAARARKADEPEYLNQEKTP
jgi:hypothetical protein